MSRTLFERRIPLHMKQRARDWDQRFAAGEDMEGGLPSPLLAQAIQGVPPGLALDLACGPGRNALFLAEHGWQVQALDASQVGLDRLLSEARRRGLGRSIEARRVDLEAPGFALAPDSCDLACDFYFLHRPLFDQIRRAVRPGGRFAAAIHLRHLPGDRGFLLEPGELRALCESWGWEVLHSRESAPGEHGHRRGSAEIVARRP